MTFLILAFRISHIYSSEKKYITKILHAQNTLSDIIKKNMYKNSETVLVIFKYKQSKNVFLTCVK